jgi:hypothetical protein
MPKQTKQSKPSSSVRSYSSASSMDHGHAAPQSSAKSCRTCPEMKLACKPFIDVAVIPEIRCRQVEDKEGHAKVAMSVKTTPSCTLKHIGQKQVSPCETVCFYDLAVKVKYDCNAEILGNCDIARAAFQGDITTRTVQRCGEAEEPRC